MTINQLKTAGASLVELIIVLAIISTIMLIAYYILNPQELVSRGRDAKRLESLKALEGSINLAIQQKPKDVKEVLCAQSPPPCQGISNLESLSVDGNGWVRINFQNSINISTLPQDPINNNIYFFTYKTNQAGDKWEINATLESTRFQTHMIKDGGNNFSKYEIGSDLTIIP